MTITFRAVVVDRVKIAQDIVHLRFARVDGHPFPTPMPGAHIDVHLDGGTVRQYSLCGTVDDGEFQIAVLRKLNGRGGSRQVHEQLQKGTELTIGLWRNNFRLVEAGRYLFIAGGIGITPLLSMIDAANAADVPWTLHYAGRSFDSMAFAKELAARYGNRVHCYPGDEQYRMDISALLRQPEPDTLIYCCGPDSMLSQVSEHAAHWPATAVRTEYFVNAALSRSPDEQPIEVVLAASGKTVEVPGGISILDAALDAGVDWPWSCKEGMCGTCEATVIDGEPMHLDTLLTEQEREAGDIMMICVSRAKSSRLVLDV